MFFLGSAILLGAAATEAAPDRIFQWTDEYGTVRYTSQLERIPRRFLPRVLVIEHGQDSEGVAFVYTVDGRPVLKSEALPDVAVVPVRKVVVIEAKPAESAGPALPEVRPGHAAVARRIVEPVSEEVEEDPFVIQLAATSLNGWLAPLERLNLLERYRLYRITAEVDGRIWERIRLGFFLTEERARRVLRQVRASFPDAWIAHTEPEERRHSDRSLISPGWGVGRAAQTGEQTNWRPYAIQLDARLQAPGLRALAALELLDDQRLYRTTITNRGESYERLRLGFFSTEREARRMLRRLSGSFPDAWIDRARPRERGDTLTAAHLPAP